MPTLDLKKQLKPYLSPPVDQPQIVDVPEMQFLMIDGHGYPGTSQEYRDALSALYSLAYGIKFTLKKGPEALDYPVMASEGLWWVEDMSQFSLERKEDWLWTMMIMQPDAVTPQLFDRMVSETMKKKPLPGLERLRLERFREGLCAQIMHIGPYSAEAPTIQKLHRFIAENGYRLCGRHHEIYLGDPNRSAPEKLRTILRQPIEK